MRLAVAAAFLLALFALPLANPVPAQAAAHACPTDLSAWRTALGAGWIDCHQLADLTTTNNPYTDPNSLTGMGYPPPGSGTLNSKYTNPTSPAVPGLQIDGWFADDGCDAFQPEPVAVNKQGQQFMQTCNATGGTCATGCHHDGEFVLRIPDSWDGHLLTAGTPGIRDAFSSDFILSDFALEKGWAYVSQDKGNMGANFYRSGCDEAGGCGSAASWPGACSDASVPWCAASAIQEWTYRVRQATRSARALLTSQLGAYGLTRLGKSYVAGISNGGYQTRRALETETSSDTLYDGGVDWEGTLFLPVVPAGVNLDQPTTGFNLYTYLPAAIANGPAAVAGDQSAIDSLAKVGFNPQSQPLWGYHYTIYWGLTQKIYRLETDPEYTAYTCSQPSGPGPSCVSPPAEVVAPSDPDATYDYRARLTALPALATRLGAIANSGDIKHPLITLHGDQDSLLPIKTDSDLYAQMVGLAGHGSVYRYYTIQGGNHVDPQFDDHNGVDSYGNNVLRPILPCAWAAINAVQAWVESGSAPPASHLVPRPANASASDLANKCDLAATAPASSGASSSPSPASSPLPFSAGPARPLPLGALALALFGVLLIGVAALVGVGARAR